MIQYFHAQTDGHLTADQQVTDNCWVNVERPTPNEIQQLVEQFKFPKDYITSILDDEENSRTEQINRADLNKPVLVIMQFPKLVTSKLGYLGYETYPFALILTKQAVLTVSNYPAEFIQDFIMEPQSSLLDVTRPQDFILRILWFISKSYVSALNNINQHAAELEKHLTRATRNEQIFRIMSFQKSLIRFKSSLAQNRPVLKQIDASDNYFNSTHHQELIADTIIENGQATTMTDTTNQILEQYSQMVSSVISNNLNDVMKVLTSLTIILTIPTIIGGIYGMNVKLPWSGFTHAFAGIMIFTILSCLWAANYLRNHNYL